jgi:hypothetical protein
MRTLVVAILVIVVLAIGGYTALWHEEATEFKSAAERWVATTNENAKMKGFAGGIIHYDSIETSGFPMSLNFRFINPVIDFPISSFLRSVATSQLHTPDPSAPESWVAEYDFSAPVQFSGNVRLNHFTLTIPGDYTIKSIVNNTPKRIIQTRSPEPMACSLDVDQPIGGALWFNRPVMSDPKTFLEVFRSLDCSVKDITTTDVASHTVLATADLSHFTVSNAPVGGVNHSIALVLEGKNLQTTPAFDGLNYQYSQMAYAIMGIPQDQRPAPMRLSEHGKINMDIDMGYLGPVDSASVSDPNMQMHFDVNTLDFNSDILKSAFDLHLASDPHGNSRTASLKIDSKTTVSPKYDAIMAEQTASAIKQAMQTEGKFGPQLQLAQTLNALNLTPQEITAAVLPKFSSFGDIVFNVDASVTGPNHGADMFKHGTITLNAFNWLSAPYGITLKGKVDMSSADGKPSGELTKTCIHCDALISDAGAYAMRIEGLGSHMQPPHVPYITSAFIEGIRQFLHGIAENPSAKDLVTDFKFNGMMFTVSGKSLPEVMALYASTIAPVQPHIQPAAGAPSELAPPAGR